MCPIQNKSGSNYYGETSFQDRNIGNDNKNIINKANSVDIAEIFQKYNLKVGQYNSSIICPFPFHKENSASFNFYRTTNSFNCFGCKNGGGTVCFVALMENISKLEAAQRIINDFNVDVNTIDNVYVDHEKRNLAYLEFSKLVREFIQMNNSSESLFFVEKLSIVFDSINQKHNLDYDGIVKLINILKIKLEQYN
jgi:DNA primase